MHLYSVFDSLSGRWHNPITMESDGVAQRNFLAALQVPDSPIAATPTDYGLYRIGSFEPETGSLESETQPVRIITALEAVHILAQKATQEAIRRKAEEASGLNADRYETN